MNNSITFQSILESVESLSTEDQDLLFEIIKKRRIEKRREEIAQNASQTLAALEAGTAKRGNVLQLLADLEEE